MHNSHLLCLRLWPLGLLIELPEQVKTLSVLQAKQQAVVDPSKIVAIGCALLLVYNFDTKALMVSEGP